MVFTNLSGFAMMREEGGDYRMKSLGTVANWLLIVGGLNWGLVGLANTNLVTMILGDGSLLTTLVYALVGASAVYVAANSLNKG